MGLVHHHPHPSMSIVMRDFIRHARNGGLFDGERFPWKEQAEAWPYRELKWVWCHPILTIGMLVWPIILIVGYGWTAAT